MNHSRNPWATLPGIATPIVCANQRFQSSGRRRATQWATRCLAGETLMSVRVTIDATEHLVQSCEQPIGHHHISFARARKSRTTGRGSDRRSAITTDGEVIIVETHEQSIRTSPHFVWTDPGDQWHYQGPVSVESDRPRNGGTSFPPLRPFLRTCRSRVQVSGNSRFWELTLLAVDLPLPKIVRKLSIVTYIVTRAKP